MYDNESSKGYNLIKWGILLSALHINVSIWIFGVQIIPSFIGLIMIAVAIGSMYKAGGARYFKNLKSSSVKLVIVSVIQFVVGLLFGYENVSGFMNLLSPAMLLLTFLYETMVFADLLNMTVRLYKDNHEIKKADKLRKDRMLYIKLSLVLAVIYGLSMIPALSIWLNYSCMILTLLMKLWLSLMLQNTSKTNLIFKEDEVIKEEAFNMENVEK
ncbi:MAG: hypothetical protein E7266_07675 [Lachnospiraceae bacterium]|nr:hypothetical protein [Lachnospiraceae bacterium]